jgi:carbon storage regulator
MLVLSRQRDETIMIGDDVEITIVDIRGDKVRLGISAPPHVAVHRKEVYEAIRREKQSQSKDGKPAAVESLANRKDKNSTSTGHDASSAPGNEKQSQ